MDMFSHILWTHVGARNKLWHEEAMLFAVLPDVGFLLIMLYVVFGTPGAKFGDAMLTLPPAFLVIYHLLHSFVTLAVVALIVWKLRPKLLPALSAWALHICMDIPFHADMFGTRFMYPLLPDLYISGMSWGDYRVLGLSYFMLLATWYYLEMRELRKHRRPGRGPDLLDRLGTFAGGLINPKPISVAHAESGDCPRASGQVPGDNRGGNGKDKDCSTGAKPPPEAG